MGGGPAKDHLLLAVPGQVPSKILDRLRKKFPAIEISSYEVTLTFDAEDIRRQLPPNVWDGITLLCTFNAFPKKLEDAPDLDFVQLLSAGSNQIQNHPIYKDSDISIATSSGIHGPQIAEWVVMTALVASHNYRHYYEAQKEHRWAKDQNSAALETVRDRVGLRLGVLGYGSIGRQVGRVAKAMGMQVLAYTASPKDTPEKKKDGGFIVPGTGDPDGEIPVEWFSGLDKESLHHFLEQDLDWLVVAVPLTKETTHFLSTAEFKKLSQGGKRKSYVTNIARGPIIDQSAMIEALKDGTLGGAALDVTDPEPLPSDSELWGLENVIVTPHVSGSGASYIDRAFQVLEMNLERRDKGERLINIVNRGRGY